MSDAEIDKLYDHWWATEGRFNCPYSALDFEVRHLRKLWIDAVRAGFIAACKAEGYYRRVSA